MVFSFLALSYCYFIASGIPKGKFRLISVIPILCLFIILPRVLDTNLLRGLTALYLVWLDPLSPKDRPIPFSHFLTLACLPINIKPTSQNNKNSSVKSPDISKPPFLFAIKVLVLVMTIFGVTTAKVLSLETEPVFNEPYLSASLQEFWSRRWNLVATNLLRVSVYEPVMKWGHLPALIATFVVSGVMHEITFFYLTGVNPTWEVTLFFVLQGLCVGLEVKVKKLVNGRWRLPLMVSTTLTVGLVMLSGWLFFSTTYKRRIR
ncbi:hypothetical protein MKX01_017432 [Papaver californicum]|nr:hypothetical protein MKX01_017432 [Papaver californicum]